MTVGVNPKAFSSVAPKSIIRGNWSPLPVNRLRVPVPLPSCL